MTDRRFTPDYDGTSFSYYIASLIADRLGDVDPLEMARTLDRHANRLRAEADETPVQYSIEPRDSHGPDYAVYDGTGEEFLFNERADAIEFITEGLEDAD